jgi:glycosyl transferase family 87
MMLSLVLTSMVGVHLWLAVEGWRTVNDGYPDFTVFYSAAEIIRQGQGHRLYDESLETQVQHQVAPKAKRRLVVPYNHPPFEALLLVPLTYLPLTVAFIAWDGINVLLLCASAYLLRRILPVMQGWPFFFTMLFLLGFFPVFNALLEGQDVIVLLLVYSLVFAAFRKGALIQAGAWLGAGFFRPHCILPFLIFMVFLKKWRVIAGSMATATGLGLISALVVGWHGLIGYPGYVWKLEHGLHKLILPARDYPNVRGLAEALLPLRVNPKVVLAIVLLAFAAAVILVLKSWHNSGPEPETSNLRFSLMIVLTVLLSYHTLFYDYTLLGMVIIVVLDYAFGSKLRNRRRLELLLPAGLLALTPLYLLFWVHRWQGSYVMAVALIAWTWVLMREIARITTVDRGPGACSQ